MRTQRGIFFALIAFCVLLLMPERASAQYVVENYGGQLWRRTYTLANNETLQLQTQGCTGSEDTALFLLEGTGATRTTRAWNDDQGSAFTEPFCSYIFFTNTSGSSKTYEAIATVYPGSLVATVTVASWRASTGWFNEVTNASLRGVTSKVWANGTVTHETAGRRQGAAGGYSDTVLYLIDTNANAASAYDDDSGLGPLSKITANLPCSSATLNCWIVGGHFSSASTNFKFEVWGRSGTDSDGDGISNDIETLKGTNASLQDTDGDGLNDYQEFFGVPAASLAGIDSSVILPWEDTGANPTAQDLFIEIDYMTASDHDHNPSLATNWPNQLGDLMGIFTNDSGFSGRTIWPHVQISNSMTETTYLSFGGSCSQADTTEFYDRKNDPAYFNPLRASIFHYSIWGHLHKHTNCSTSSWIGQGEIWGNDVIVTLGGGVNQVGGTLLQRVNYIHELGHNLALSHNENGNSNPNNSCVHASVMNYRFSNGGWNNAVRGSGYSNGTCSAVVPACANTCAANRCVPSNQASPKSGCSPNNGSCDCDRNEWSVVNLDIPSSGQMSYEGCQASDCGNGNGPPTEQARAFFLNGGPVHGQLQRVAEQRRALLTQRGLVAGKDFLMHPENGRSYSIE